MAFLKGSPILNFLIPQSWFASPITMEDERRRYNDRIAGFRRHEYPMLEGTTYLDHAGTTLYSRSLIDSFAAEMLTSLVGNPHSASNSAMSTAYRIDNVRSRVLKLFKADPDHFDVVFVANATAAIKLVAEAFRDHQSGFWYGYHKDAHTSVVGVRELAGQGSRCFKSDQEVEHWLDEVPPSREESQPPLLFAYPGQSNMNGRRLPLQWPGYLRRSRRTNAYTLLDAAAFVSTNTLDLSDADNAPDFVSLSFYKIFGFPDLGALIVRKDAAHVFDNRRYFGGGTVEMVTCLEDQWHQMKRTSLHARLEDGTLPLRSIIALGCAMDAHQKLFGGLDEVSKHTSWLAKHLYERMMGLKHASGGPICKIYKDNASTYGDPKTQGSTVVFNLCDSKGNWFSNHELNKLASVKRFHIRTGTLCNPGGMANALDIHADELKSYFAAGFRCGSENDVRGGKAVGMARVSLGASSTSEDVDRWMEFIEEYFVEKASPAPNILTTTASPLNDQLYVESLTIYPIKSCGGYSIPAGKDWIVRPQGLAWDREWCLVHQSTRESLSQKRCPGMALMKPRLDLAANILHVHYAGVPNQSIPSDIIIPLLFDELPSTISNSCPTNVCGDEVNPRIYTSPDITSFFSAHLGTPCHLAWLPTTSPLLPQRVAKSLATIRSPPQQGGLDAVSSTGPAVLPTPPPSPLNHPITLANESPILTISRASLSHLNASTSSELWSKGDKAAIGPERFRANILLAPRHANSGVAYAEDSWDSMRIMHHSSPRRYDLSLPSAEQSDFTELQVLGPCRRCQMVCIDQHTGKRCSEPFSTLAKTRRWNGGVWFGVHCGLAAGRGFEKVITNTIRVGDWVEGIMHEGRKVAQ